MLLRSAAFRITQSQKIDADVFIVVAASVVVSSIGLHTCTRFEASTPSAKQTRYANEALCLDKGMSSMWGRKNEREGDRCTLDTNRVDTRARTA